jgi:tetrapyrrole methylase family protein/MazG family protein
LIEETYECVEAIDEKDPFHVKEELGDIFLLAVMISYMYEEEGKFSVAGALEGISEKLIRRHPHVFAGLSVKDSAEVLDNWAKIKVEQEGRKPKDSILDEVSRGLPPLDRAWKLQKKAAKAGFDWPGIEGVVSKVTEELKELSDAIASGAAGTPSGAVEEELGDLLFSVVNLCRHLHVEPSVALQRTNIKFTERFKYVEKRMKESGAGMKQENLGLMDSYWNEAKSAERSSRTVPYSSC